MVEGYVDDANVIVHKFASHFTSVGLFCCNDPTRASSIEADYETLCIDYCGLLLDVTHYIDTELVSKLISELQHSKAIDIDGLSAEHLHICQPSLYRYSCLNCLI